MQCADRDAPVDRDGLPGQVSGPGGTEEEHRLGYVVGGAEPAERHAALAQPAHFRIGEDGLRITLAVAGFSSDDLVIELVENQLTVRGKQADDPTRVYLHRGIAARQFQRAFMLADGIEVTGARLDNGLLSIDLVRPQAEPRIRNIRIDSGQPVEAGNTIDITARRTGSR